MSKFKFFTFIMSVVLSTFCFTSCNDDDPVPPLTPTDSYKVIVVSAEGGNLTEDMRASWLKRTWEINHVSFERAVEYWNLSVNNLVDSYSGGLKIAGEVEDEKGNVIDTIPFEGTLTLKLEFVKLVNQYDEEGKVVSTTEEVLDSATVILTPTTSELVK